MKFSVISLDLWNTIIDSSNTENRRAHRINGLTNLLKPHKPEITNDQSESLIREQVHWFDLVWKKEHKTPRTEVLVERILDRVKLGEANELKKPIVQLFEEGILIAPPALTPGLADFLESMKGRYDFGIISDTHFSPGKVVRQLLEKHGVLKYFRHFSFSDENGVSKPNAAMYEKICRSAGVLPAQLLHIGDMDRTDITGAVQFGAGSILYAGANQQDKEKNLADATASHWLEVPQLIRSIESRRF